MSGIEDNARNLAWWHDQLNLSDDWNSMPKDMRKDLLEKLNSVFIEIAEFNITKQELLDLIILTDQTTVWDAMLVLQKLPNRAKNRWQVLAYLKATVINMWKSQHPNKKPVFQPPPPEPTPRKVASERIVQKWNPLNFGREHCKTCGGTIRSDNRTGVCRTCQRSGNGKEHEH